MILIEIDAFLGHLATHVHVAAATRRQALNAIVSFTQVLNEPIEGQLEPVRSKRRPEPRRHDHGRGPQRVLGQMLSTHLLMTKMFYDAGCG